MSRVQPIRFDPQGSFVSGHGISKEQFAGLGSRLTEVRDEILKVDLEHYASGVIPADKQPLDAGFLELPERLLADYHANRDGS